MFIDYPSRLEAAFVQRDDSNAYYEQVNITGSDLIIYLDSNGKLTADKIPIWANIYNIGLVSGSYSSISSSWASSSINSSVSISASYARTASYSISSSYARTASYSISSSYARTASYASYAVSASYAPPTLNGKVIVFCTAYTPYETGPDMAEIPLPYDPHRGVTPVTWSIKRFAFRTVEPEVNASTVRFEKSTGSGLFNPISLESITLNSGEYETVTSSVNHILTGEKIRFNVVTLGSATNWTLTAEIMTP